MKIYTKTGDQGETGLYSGKRVPKDDPLLHAYGSVDELNAFIGWLRMDPLVLEFAPALLRIQNELFDVGADLATPWEDRQSEKKNIKRIESTGTQTLEEEIDHAEEELKPLRQFILPGGSSQAAIFHICRTVCRRAERAVASLVREGRGNPEILVYLNRLSDWLFVMARVCNQRLGKSDLEWKTK